MLAVFLGLNLSSVLSVMSVKPVTAEENRWWSLVTPEKLSVPVNDNASSAWSKNPIDAFIYEKLQSIHLPVSARASRHTLIRRMTLDLTGLPPSVEHVEAFVNDPQETLVAVEHLLDRLLASKHYGERWAQHWLDVFRWAETVGFETNAERRDAWHYRDWVIASLNQDKPYDQFIFDQLAGDTNGNDAALGFLVAGPANLPGQIGRDEEAMRGARQDELDEVIRTVGQTLFGMTFGCARCHDHKFDPIKLTDYYSMQAIFSGLEYGSRRLRGQTNDDWGEMIPGLQSELASLHQSLAGLRKQHQLRLPLTPVQSETFKPVGTTAVRMTIHATDRQSAASLYEFEIWAGGQNVALASNGGTASASSFALENQTRHFENLIDGSIDRRQAFAWVADQKGEAWIQIDLPGSREVDRIVWHNGSSVPADYVIELLVTGESGQTDWQRVADTKDRQPRINDLRAPEDVRLKGMSKKEIQALMKVIASVRAKQRDFDRRKAGPQVYAASFDAQPDPTYALDRGDAMRRLKQVSSGMPQAMGPYGLAADAKEVDRRIALANHLTQPNHPLTARVIVNRLWQGHFGVGLVETSSDFGKMGAAPSHPELLDWLAREMIDHGWSIKYMHRLIMRSQTYQQGSRPTPEGLKADSQSRLLWRYPPRRLEAEAIRDSILSVSGRLNLKMGGKGFNLFKQRGGLADYQPIEKFDQSGWRRMIYAHKVRMQGVDVFGAFDCPDFGQMKPKRTRSITPLQSLGLFNSVFVNRQATFLSERLQAEAGQDFGSQIELLFRLAYARLADPDEKQQLMKLAELHGMTQVCRVIFNTSEFIYLQ